MHKIQVPFHEPPYLYLYDEEELGAKPKVVTTEGVSCITTQTNSKGVFLCFNVKKQMRGSIGGKPAHDTQVYTRETREYMHVRLAKHKSRA